MNYSFTDQFAKDNMEYLQEAMMGPNAMRVSEEMAGFLDIKENMRVLDLGCGAGLSSLFLAKKYGATVFAADLWVSPTENYERFKRIGIDRNVVPLSVDATKGLPFAERYFDILFSVDSYHYFGADDWMLPSLIPMVKKGGYVAVAVPGLKKGNWINDFPEELKPFWVPNLNFYTVSWWKNLWSRCSGVEVVCAREMDCCTQAWDEWLLTSNPYAVSDRAMMEAEGGKYYNLVQIIAKVL